MEPPEAAGVTELSPRSPAEPDLMNDASYDTHAQADGKSLEDTDTCRICRGEGSEEEPLFYPCKCSGSIKYVHQNCLMEWLSHSQKKHCELCKTPFRFTKLYDAHMPSTVPIPVFLRQAALHTWKNLLTWSRFHLVAFVWVFWLPWCMRTVWRGLFWIGDGGWVDVKQRALDANATNYEDSIKLRSNHTIWSNPMSKDAIASALISHMSDKLSRISFPLTTVLKLDYGEPIAYKLLKQLYRDFFGSNSNQTSAVPANNASATPRPALRSSTWLSDFEALNTLTRSTTMNNVIIDTLEGQLLTILLVTVFILIFLIREWVMQQQQNLLLGPDGNPGAAIARNDEGLGQDNADDRPGEEMQQEIQHGGGNEEVAENGNHIAGPAARILARPRRRLHRRPTQPENQGRHDAPAATEVANRREDSDFAASPHHSIQQTQQPESSQERNERVERFSDRILRAVERRREREEWYRFAGQDSGVDTFKELWERAAHKPAEVVRIIREEKQGTDTRWIVDLIQNLEKNPEAETLSTTTSPRVSSALKHCDAHEDADLEGLEALDLPNLPDFSSLPGPAQSQAGTSSSKVGQHKGEQSVESKEAAKAREEVEVQHQSRRPSSPVHWTWPSEFDNPRDAGPPELTQTTGNEVGESNTVSAEVHGGQTETLPTEEGLEPEDPVPDDIVDASTDPEPHTKSLAEILTNWLWGGVEMAEAPIALQVGDDEHVVDVLADEAPFVPVARGQHQLPGQNEVPNQGQDPEVLAAAAQAGIDPNEAEVMDDIEDMEGIMELIGMQGPLAGLVQNGVFCAVLVSLTIGSGIWIPYIFGKIFLNILASPISILVIQPLRITSSCADIIVDLFVFGAGLSFYWADAMITFICAPIGWLIPPLGRLAKNKIVAHAAKSYAENALDRLAKAFMATGEHVLRGLDVPKYSVVAHESLQFIETQTTAMLHLTYVRTAELLDLVRETTGVLENTKLAAYTLKAFYGKLTENVTLLLSATPKLLQINPLRVDLARSHRTSPFDYSLASWDAQDRAIAILFGYLFVALLGVVYLHAAAAMKGTNKRGRVEGGLAEVLYQAGGVMKVILIISIEMIVFPLYCGLLLDVALLPLFGNVTSMSRVEFTIASPNTSLFVHWFVGTCYMFHFALFVSMCRKILRKGVLYFIRDPDDPTFHPVRDVLERSVSTQLWKISFSAMVYGGLVLVCLGGVVWGMAFAFKGVFPIHWSSNEPVLEFPVDLLFYNFLMPLAIKFFRPSTGLTKMYTWWFRKCARTLRLTNFLFNEDKADEEGGHVRRTWRDVFRGEKGNVMQSISREEHQAMGQEPKLKTYYVRDGRYVRAPASDQVRIPKGATTFVEVDIDNNRVDGQEDSDDGLHSRKSEMFTQVYIPPFFRIRIAIFVFFIWLFATATGVSVTIIPLIFGRLVFAKLTPSHLRMNDIYAFSTGIYILGGTLYALLHHRAITTYINDTLKPHATTLTSFLRKTGHIALRILGLLYTYSAFAILLPALFSLLIECYLIIPLQTYFSTPLTLATLNDLTNLNPTSPTTQPQPQRPIIHLIQDWTLGVLYIKMFARLILWNAPSRPATALRSIVRRGYFNPDIWLATRGFILPATIAMLIALTLPLGLGWVATHTFLKGLSENEFARACVYRYAYPAVLAVGVAGVLLVGLGKAFGGWRRRVRDEVYLIGERLHNFGEGKRKRGRREKGKGVVGRA